MNKEPASPQNECAAGEQQQSAGAAQKGLVRQLQALGHRNWVVVADSAYPQHAAAGVSTVVYPTDALSALDFVLGWANKAEHVRPRCLLDAELPYLDEKHAPGIWQLRTALESKLSRYPVEYLPHAELLRKVAEAAQHYQVLVIKTSCRLPYTTVFLELQCGYWDEAAEDVLRKAMSSVSLQGLSGKKGEG